MLITLKSDFGPTVGFLQIALRQAYKIFPRVTPVPPVVYLVGLRSREGGITVDFDPEGKYAPHAFEELALPDSAASMIVEHLRGLAASEVEQELETLISLGHWLKETLAPWLCSDGNAIRYSSEPVNTQGGIVFVVLEWNRKAFDHNHSIEAAQGFEDTLVLETIRAYLGRCESALAIRGSAERIEEVFGVGQDDIMRIAGSFLAYDSVLQATQQPRGMIYPPFEMANMVSAMTYEGAEPRGAIQFVDPADPSNITMRLKFRESIPLDRYRGVRKLLEITDGQNHLLSDGRDIIGLGTANAGDTKIEFRGDHCWNFIVDP